MNRKKRGRGGGGKELKEVEGGEELKVSGELMELDGEGVKYVRGVGGGVKIGWRSWTEEELK